MCLKRRLARVGAGDQVADRPVFKRAWVPIGLGHDKVDGLVDPGLGHAEVLKTSMVRHAREGKTVLVVDDEPTVHLPVKDVLED